MSFISKQIPLAWALLSIVLSTPAMSSGPTGPFQRPSASTVPRTVLNWVDNLTVGSINTFVGAGNILVALIANPILGKSMIQIEATKENSGQQLLVHNGNFSEDFGAYSLGIFNMGGVVPDHEAGHSQQSAALGPLYLPTVGLSYLIQGHNDSFVEKWANLEGDTYYNGHSMTFPVKVGTGFLRSPGAATVPYLVLSFAVDERTNIDSSDVRLQKIYEWMRANVVVPVVRQQVKKGGALPLGFEVNLLRKTIWTGVTLWNSHSGTDAALDFQFKTQQDYVRAELNPLSGVLRANALKWATELGLTYRFGENFSMSATGGGSVGFDGYRAFLNSGAFQKDEQGIGLGLAARASLSLTWLKYLTVYGTVEQYWLVDQYRSRAFEAGITNTFRHTDNEIPDFWNYLDLTTRYRLEELSRFGGDHPVTRIHQLELLAGVRF